MREKRNKDEDLRLTDEEIFKCVFYSLACFVVFLAIMGVL